MVGGQEKRLLGLEKLPGDPASLLLERSGVSPDPPLDSGIFLCAFISGPHFVSNGSGFNGSCSVGFCFTILSLAFSAALRAFSLLSFISLQGLMPTRNPCLLVIGDGPGSLSILMDNFLAFWEMKTCHSLRDVILNCFQRCGKKKKNEVKWLL